VKYHKDDDGRPTRHGDKVRFSFGIPPLTVIGDIAEEDGKLYVLTPNNNPKRYRLNKLRACVGGWWKEAK
jgi:hypothetical protein